ncbi:MAG: cysteine peptidase family C39 domain-containing protein [Planctomycetota bacterium]|jgi:hypothetical protein
MKIRLSILVLLSVLVTHGTAFGDRHLNRTEIVQIFQTLTAQPRRTWIPSGIIQAEHFQYRASTGYTADSSILARYDGDRFYLEITRNSSVGETEPGAPARATQAGPANKQITVWDGDRHTMYFKSTKNAIVTEGLSDVPIGLIGPLTAGIVPWGHGSYTLDSLLAAESFAMGDDQGLVHLTIRMPANELNVEILFVLDPTKQYAVLSCSMNDGGVSSIEKTYEDYDLVSGRWIPTTIAIERYKYSGQTPQLVSSDYWYLTYIRISSPDLTAFRVAYEEGAYIGFFSPLTESPLSYYYSNAVDIESLLHDRLAFAAGDPQTQNCATVAMKYAAMRLGKNVPDANLAQLVHGPDKSTTLYDLRRFAQKLGLHCRAVKTDIQTLKNLDGSQAILHLPGPKHYVILDHVDNDYAWIIDLDGSKFYYPLKLEDLVAIDWREGTALLLSNEPATLQGTSAEINDAELINIIGSTGGGTDTYSCTQVIQQGNSAYCVYAPPALVCDGQYRIWNCLKGCTPDPQGGSCVGTLHTALRSWLCGEDPEYPGECTNTSDVHITYMHACSYCN